MSTEPNPSEFPELADLRVTRCGPEWIAEPVQRQLSSGNVAAVARFRAASLELAELLAGKRLVLDLRGHDLRVGADVFHALMLVHKRMVAAGGEFSVYPDNIGVVRALNHDGRLPLCDPSADADVGGVA